MKAATRAPRGPLTAADPAGPADRSTRPPVWVVVAVSPVSGLVNALVLILGVFAGANEHVITGSALLGFASGWALLAVYSARLTSQPQRWALVPAAVMAVTGLGLLALAPGDGALNAAGWVWPPAALTLAGWMVVALRRALVGRSRWLLYSVVGALAVAALGGMYESVALARDESRYVPPGTSYDVGGHRLHLNCTGTGSPAVALENGLSETSPIWSPHHSGGRPQHPGVRLRPDRAGLERRRNSSAGQHRCRRGPAHPAAPRARERSAHPRRALRRRRLRDDLRRPVHPTQVAGLVLLDSSSPDQFTALPDFSRSYALSRRMLAVVPSLARLGVAQVAPASAFSDLPALAAAQVRAFATSPRGMRNIRDEHSGYRAAFRQAQALTTFGGKPLAVVTSSQNEYGTRGWSAAQDQLATLSSNSSHWVADTTHVGLLDQPAGSADSVRAITEVVASVRTGTPPALPVSHHDRRHRAKPLPRPGPDSTTRSIPAQPCPPQSRPEELSCTPPNSRRSALAQRRVTSPLRTSTSTSTGTVTP